MTDVAVGLTVTDGDVVHTRCWYVQPHLAESFAEHMTAWYGQPDEMTASRETIEAQGNRAAAEGDAVFLIGAESGSDG